MSTGRSDLVDVTASLRGETDLAWRIDNGSVTVWLPKSQAERNDDGTFTMHEWLALEKGLI